MKYLIPILILLILPIINADMGPKPTAEIEVYENGQLIQGRFTTRMLTCKQPRKYEEIAEQIIKENKPFNLSQCNNNPEQYGLEFQECTAVNRIITMEREGGQFYCKQADKQTCELIKKTKIKDGDCYWQPDGLAWGGEGSTGKTQMGYFLPQEFKLAIYHNQRTIITNTINKESFDAKYEVQITNEQATIKDVSPIISKSTTISYLIALILTLIIEIIIAIIFLLITKDSWKTIKYLIIGNIITLTMLWFVWPLLKYKGLWFPLGEIFAFSLEAWIYKKYAGLTTKKAIILSLIANWASFIIGFLSLIF